MGIRAADFKDHIIIPVLTWLDPLIPFSRFAVNQLLGTAAVESDMAFYLDQTTPGPGPGFGPYQMEEGTFNDHCDWMMRFRKDLWAKFDQVQIPKHFSRDGVVELQGNFYLATMLARIHYYRIRQLMPTTLMGQAQQWKQFYNTWKGKGTVEKYLESYQQLVGKVGQF